MWSFDNGLTGRPNFHTLLNYRTIDKDRDKDIEMWRSSALARKATHKPVTRITSQHLSALFFHHHRIKQPIIDT